MPQRAATTQATGPIPHGGGRRGGIPVDPAATEAVEELCAAAAARGWAALHVVPVLVGSGTAARALSAAALAAEPEAVAAERVLALPAWGRLDRLVAVGVPDGAVAARIADALRARLQAPIRRGGAAVAPTLHVRV
jgi:hypothetical protein